MLLKLPKQECGICPKLSKKSAQEVQTSAKNPGKKNLIFSVIRLYIFERVKRNVGRRRVDTCSGGRGIWVSTWGPVSRWRGRNRCSTSCPNSLHGGPRKTLGEIAKPGWKDANCARPRTNIHGMKLHSKRSVHIGLFIASRLILWRCIQSV